MRALVVTQPGSAQPAEIREVAEPVPGPSEALLKVEAVSLNRGELRQLASYPDWVPGQDVGGVVLEAAADGSGPPTGTLAYLARLIGDGRLQPQIGLELSWREIGHAVAALRDRQVNGKVVLTVD